MSQCVQQKERIYQIDSVQPVIIFLVERNINGNHETITDMARSLVFLIHDGAHQLDPDDDRTRIYRKCLKTFIREVGDRVNPEIHFGLFDLVRYLYGKFYPQLPPPSLCVEEVEKQKNREIQEKRQQEKHQKHLQKRNVQ